MAEQAENPTPPPQLDKAIRWAQKASELTTRGAKPSLPEGTKRGLSAVREQTIKEIRGKLSQKPLEKAA